MSLETTTVVGGTVRYGECPEKFIITLSDDEESGYESDTKWEEYQHTTLESQPLNFTYETDSETRSYYSAVTSFVDASAPTPVPGTSSTPTHSAPLPTPSATNPLEPMVDNLLLALKARYAYHDVVPLEHAITTYLHTHPVAPADVELLVPSLKHRSAIMNKLTTNIAIHYVHKRIRPADKDTILERLLTHGSMRLRDGSWSDQNFEMAAEKIQKFLDQHEKRSRGDPDEAPRRWKRYQRTQRNKEAQRREAEKVEEREYARRIAEFPERLRKPFETALEREWIGAVSFADYYYGLWDLKWADVKQIQARADEKKKRELKEKTRTKTAQETEKKKAGGVQPGAGSAELFGRNGDKRICYPKRLPSLPLRSKGRLPSDLPVIESRPKRSEEDAEADGRGASDEIPHLHTTEEQDKSKEEMPQQPASLPKKKQEKWWWSRIAVPRRLERGD